MVMLSTSNQNQSHSQALVVFSGGQDSTTCLQWAKNRYEKVSAITFDYGQRHAIELEQSKWLCQQLSIPQKIVNISFLDQLADSALLGHGDMNSFNAKGLPASFVPNRNQLFITLAHAYAQKISATILVLGVCQADFSGYPDCRQVFIDAIEKASNLGSDDHIRIETPLMDLDKGDIFALAEQEGCLDWVVEHSHTCYHGDRSQRQAWGYGCNACIACDLRAKGWQTYQERVANDA